MHMYMYIRMHTYASSLLPAATYNATAAAEAGHRYIRKATADWTMQVYIPTIRYPHHPLHGIMSSPPAQYISETPHDAGIMGHNIAVCVRNQRNHMIHGT